MKIFPLFITILFSLFLISCSANTPQTPIPSFGGTETSVSPTEELPKKDFSNDTPQQLYEQAVKYLRDVAYYRLEGEGAVKNTLSTQNMRTLFEKDGDRYCNLSFSSGFVNTATEILSQSDEITIRQGKYDSKTETAAYGKPKTLTEQTFRQEWGGESTFPFCYQITEQTILSSWGEVDNGCYVGGFHLHPQHATQEYTKRMKKSGDISAPSFQQLTFGFTLDAYGRFQTVTLQEEYCVKILFNVKCEMQLTHGFFYGK